MGASVTSESALSGRPLLESESYEFGSQASNRRYLEKAKEGALIEYNQPQRFGCAAELGDMGAGQVASQISQGHRGLVIRREWYSHPYHVHTSF